MYSIPYKSIWLHRKCRHNHLRKKKHWPIYSQQCIKAQSDMASSLLNKVTSSTAQLSSPTHQQRSAYKGTAARVSPLSMCSLPREYASRVASECRSQQIYILLWMFSYIQVATVAQREVGSRLVCWGGSCVLSCNHLYLLHRPRRSLKICSHCCGISNCY